MFLTPAFAQADAATSGLASMGFGGLMVWVAVGLIIASLVAVVCDRSVTSGQAILAALGVGVLVLPHVVNFEWSDGAIKFTTREAGATLTEAVRQQTKNEAEIRRQLNELVRQVTAISQRVDQVEVGSNGPANETPNNQYDSLQGNLNSRELNTIFEQNEAAIEAANAQASQLQTLQFELGTAPMQ